MKYYKTKVNNTFGVVVRVRAVGVLVCFAVGLANGPAAQGYRLPKNDEKCPEVRARSNCDLDAVRSLEILIFFFFFCEYRSTKV